MAINLNGQDLQELGDARILVIGDVILDRYTWGDAERVSPEAPVLVLQADDRQHRLGGAASVCGLLRSLGANVALGGVVGDDGDGSTLRDLLADNGVDVSLLMVDASRPTTTKERFVGRAAQRHAHQILRVDREKRDPLSPGVELKLLNGLESRLASCQAVLISDYAKGVCTPRLLAQLIAAAQSSKCPVIIDPARTVDFGRYRGASILTPNRSELAYGAQRAVSSPSDALDVGRQLCRDFDIETTLVTLDRDGIAVTHADGDGQILPAKPRQVYDVTGAGDMVLAVVGLCQAAGWEAIPSAELANVAAGLEVERFGVAPVTWSEIRAELDCDQRKTKVLDVEELTALAEAYRRAGKKVVFTNGCFDLLHVGHVTYLEQAAELGDVLIVAVNTDGSVKRLKGSKRPIIGHDPRAKMLAALSCVNHVVLFEEDTPHELLRRVRPDVLLKGGTYTTDEVVGAEVVRAYGGEVCVVGRVPGASTSEIVAQISEADSCKRRCLKKIARGPILGIEANASESLG